MAVEEIVKVRCTKGNASLTVPQSIRGLLKSRFMTVELQNDGKIVYTPVK